MAVLPQGIERELSVEEIGHNQCLTDRLRDNSNQSTRARDSNLVHQTFNISPVEFLIMDSSLQ